MYGKSLQALHTHLLIHAAATLSFKPSCSAELCIELAQLTSWPKSGVWRGIQGVQASDFP